MLFRSSLFSLMFLPSAMSWTDGCVLKTPAINLFFLVSLFNSISTMWRLFLCNLVSYLKLWCICILFFIFVVQSLSHVQLFATPWTAARKASLSVTSSQSLLKLMSIESVMPSNHLILCRPLLLLPSVFPSLRVFSNESTLCIRWPKDWSFSFSISPSNEYSVLISFRIGWFDLLTVQETLKSLLQDYSSKSS